MRKRRVSTVEHRGLANRQGFNLAPMKSTAQVAEHMGAYCVMVQEDGKTPGEDKDVEQLFRCTLVMLETVLCELRRRGIDDEKVAQEFRSKQEAKDQS